MKKRSNSIETKGKKILVVGMGISGFYSAQWLANQGAKVIVTDNRDKSELNSEFYEKLRELGVKLEIGNHNKESFLHADMIVVSPGVPIDILELKLAYGKGIPVIGELELAGLLVKAPIIAVTGTNGKSTVTTMLGDLLKKAGYETFVGGNIGMPLIAHVAEGNTAQYAVVEVSSFQLDTISKFCPFISVILNVSPDHLDRYVDFDSYVNSKLKIFMNQRREDFLILNDDDSWLSAVNPKSEITVLRYGFEEKKGRRAFLKGETIKSSVAGREKMNVPIKSVKLTGKHNVSNIMAVTLCAHVLGIGESLITECIGDFKGLKNRLEWVNDIGGVSFINDSKATNLDAAIKAVMSIEQSLILIAGGLHKGADYGPLVETCKGKVKHCVFLGESKKMLADAFAGVIPYDVANDMEEAVSTAFSKSNPGDVVLLAPACSSFDMYRDYADRGESFSNAVERLKSEQGKLSQHRI